jgi:hypothetical protein
VNLSYKDLLTEDFLKREYLDLLKSVHQIAKENNIRSSHSVSQALRKFGISRKSKKNSIDIFTKDFLEEYYVRQNMSLKAVAMLGGKINKGVVVKYLKKFDIPIRDITISEKLLSSRKRKRDEFFSGRYWKGVINGAKQRNIDFCITKEFAYNLFLKQSGRCAISGVEIFLLWDSYEDIGGRTASLDRINSLGHYTEDNVQWVHKDINNMKQSYSQKYFIDWCKIVAIFNKETS